MFYRLGQRIKDLRTAKGLTQGEVAERIEISERRYASIEDGIGTASYDILSKLACVFGVAVGDITKVLDEPPVVFCETKDTIRDTADARER